MSIYVIGDIQGCYDPLQRLLEKIHFDPSTDQLWGVGDMVNRGPQNIEVLRLLKQLDHAFIGVLGNHDLHLLAVSKGYRELKNGDTIQDVLSAPDAEEILHWVQQLPLVHYDKTLNSMLVHAGIPPQWSVKSTLKHANEVHSVINSEQQDEYFSHMYGNKPNLWKKSLVGPERWRLITNYFTRMRFCETDGTLDLKAKYAPDQSPKHLMPWYQVPERKTANTNIFFGHWATLLGNADGENIYATDTGCVWGNVLSVVDIANPEIKISVPATI